MHDSIYFGKGYKALKKVGFEERLKEFKQGLDTALYKNFTDDGIEISGGEDGL